jgi:hypothetical protein
MPETRTASLAAALSERSRREFYNVYGAFDWSEPIPADAFWLPQGMLTTYGTSIHEAAGPGRLRELSKWETINLFSVFCVGEADLVREIVQRIHRPGVEPYFDYFTHFIDEENKHMWFFKQFCLAYAGKLYDFKKIGFGGEGMSHLDDFLAFMKVALFEEFGDLYNVAAIRDRAIPEPVRRIHRVHHNDEVGHILVGREIAAMLFRDHVSKLPPDNVARALKYLRGYLNWVLESAYNPQAYRDAGFADPYGMRLSLLGDAARKERHRSMAGEILSRYPSIFGEPSPAGDSHVRNHR